MCSHYFISINMFYYFISHIYSAKREVNCNGTEEGERKTRICMLGKAILVTAYMLKTAPTSFF